MSDIPPQPPMPPAAQHPTQQPPTSQQPAPPGPPPYQGPPPQQPPPQGPPQQGPPPAPQPNPPFAAQQPPPPEFQPNPPFADPPEQVQPAPQPPSEQAAPPEDHEPEPQPPEETVESDEVEDCDASAEPDASDDAGADDAEPAKAEKPERSLRQIRSDIDSYLKALTDWSTSPKHRKPNAGFLEKKIAKEEATLDDIDEEIKEAVGIEKAEAAAKKAAVMERLSDLQEKLTRLEGFDQLEQIFIADAAQYAEAKNIPHQAWREAGVSGKVLKEAGILPKAKL